MNVLTGLLVKCSREILKKEPGGCLSPRLRGDGLLPAEEKRPGLYGGHEGKSQQRDFAASLLSLLHFSCILLLYSQLTEKYSAGVIVPTPDGDIVIPD